MSQNCSILCYYLALLVVMNTAKTTPEENQAAQVTRVVGDEVEISCGLKTDKGGIIVWKTGSRVLFAGNMRIRRDRRLSLVNSKLVIKRVECGDAGEYSCETETLSGGVLMMVTYLAILSPPSVHILGGDGAVTVKYGASLKLTCIGEGVPVPQVSWWRRDAIIATSVGEATIELNNVDHRDAGDIICKADNGVGEVSEDAVSLHVLAPRHYLLSI